VPSFSERFSHLSSFFCFCFCFYFFFSVSFACDTYVHTHVRLSPTTDRPAARKTPKTAKQRNSKTAAMALLPPCRPVALPPSPISHCRYSAVASCQLPVASCQLPGHPPTPVTRAQ
jgi:hypothetical protein